MEMEEITGEKNKVLEHDERKVDGAESTVYSKLESSSENIYVEAGQPSSPGPASSTDRPVEEAELSVYSKLTGPSENIYAETSHGQPSAGDRPDLQVRGNIGVYRFMCLLLSIICLVLLMVITVLSVKLQSQPLVCPGTDKWIEAEEKVVEVKDERSFRAEERPQFSKLCSLQKCQAHYSQQLSQLYGCNKCENGWLYFENSCYFLSSSRMKWNESRDDCLMRGGDLAVITNQRVQTFLTEKGNLMYWIGLRQNSGSWVWVNNMVLGQSYWSEKDRHQECGLLAGRALPEKSWNSSPCEIFTFYICQKGI